MADYKKLSDERKQLQSQGLLPKWYTTAGWALFKGKYLYEADNAKEQYTRIARIAAKHTDNPRFWEDVFFINLWTGKWSPSTPVLANMGTDRGMPVSCSGSVIDDSVNGFYSNLRETALLTKHGFGTSSDLSSIRPRGSKISVGGKASGIMPVLKKHVQAMRDVAQGTARRGAWAGYLDIEHGDFDELCDYLKKHPDDLNVGWNIHKSFIDKLQRGCFEADRRFCKVMKIKMLTGKGYFYFPDRVEEQQPECYKQLGLSSKASNLCTEITLHADRDHTYTCVLSSLNLARLKDEEIEDSAYKLTIFLDCVAQEFIERAKYTPGLEKAVRATQKGRALGLGVCGFHTALQQRMLAFDSFEATLYNGNVFKNIKEGAEIASKDLVRWRGEPEWCQGTGRANTHLIAVAPTMSTALIMGGVSQGIEPMYGNCYSQKGAGGEVYRINPVFLELAKERGRYDEDLFNDVSNNYGSVQHLDWLTDHEKRVFRTGFEIPQEVIVRMASQRQQWIDQAQSINLFFGANESESRISEIMKLVFLDKRIKSQYYIHTQAGVSGSTGECSACQ